MNVAKTRLIGAFSAVVSFFAAFFVCTSFENFSGMVRVSAVVAAALAIGACQGLFIERQWHKAVGLGTFVGMFILWLPVIAVTYGFALLALPLLAAFAVLVFYGAKLGARLRKNVFGAA